MIRLPLALVATATVSVSTANAQTDPIPPLDADDRAAVVERIGELLDARYVFPDVARDCDVQLRAELAAGTFDDVTDPEAFARALTETLQEASHDKHMRVRVRPPERAQEDRENPARSQARQLEWMRQSNYGFERVERLEGNVGYLDMRFFAGTPRARPTAVAAMNFLANTDAIVFDMRKNGGGSPEMIRFVCSYLFEEPTHLNSLYWREGDRTEEFWTLPEVPGPRMTDVPVFVLTSSYTFSGAEEFSYNLQTRQRATLVGETTGGGANPGGVVPIDERFGIFIPTGRAINPVTGTNWEGVGVVPEVATGADEAYDEALALAQAAAEAHRTERSARVDALWTAFGERQAEAISLADARQRAEADGVITAALRAMHEAGLIGEMEVNGLGYEMLGRDHIGLAIAVFKFNVEAHPESGNVYDSLAEAYMSNDQDDLAIAFYERSLEVDPSNDNAREMIRRIKSDR
jgi:tetratricopeptide (TPR) repeat protein